MIKPKFNIGNKVFIISSRKTTGEYNRGFVVGIKSAYKTIGYISERQFFRDINVEKYQVAYIDCFTKRAEIGFYTERELTEKLEAPQ